MSIEKKKKVTTEPDRFLYAPTVKVVNHGLGPPNGLNDKSYSAHWTHMTKYTLSAPEHVTESMFNVKGSYGKMQHPSCEQVIYNNK